MGCAATRSKQVLKQADNDFLGNKDFSEFAERYSAASVCRNTMNTDGEMDRRREHKDAHLRPPAAPNNNNFSWLMPSLPRQGSTVSTLE